MYIYFLRGKTNGVKLDIWPPLLTAAPRKQATSCHFLSVTQSFGNSWSNSRFEIQRLKCTYSIWREQMMCAASVTFEIGFISANKTLEQSRVSRVIRLALFHHLCSESQSLLQWTLDSPQSECVCENRFTFTPADHKQSLSALFKESCYFACKELWNKRGTAGWWELLVFNHEMNRSRCVLLPKFNLSVWSLILRCHKPVGVPLLVFHMQ